MAGDKIRISFFVQGLSLWLALLLLLWSVVVVSTLLDGADRVAVMGSFASSGSVLALDRRRCFRPFKVPVVESPCSGAERFRVLALVAVRGFPILCLGFGFGVMTIKVAARLSLHCQFMDTATTMAKFLPPLGRRCRLLRI